MPTDSNKQSFELIEYKLDTLMSTVSNGFSRLDGQSTDMQKRIAKLETWQARVEARTPQKEEPDWSENLVKIILVVAGALGTALTIILTQLKGK